MPLDWMPILQTGGVTTVAIFAITILQRTWEGRLADQKPRRKSWYNSGRHSWRCPRRLWRL